jgi:putative aldouronate transport system permease protein
MSIVFALMLNEIMATKFKKAVQTISYMPYFVSMVLSQA